MPEYRAYLVGNDGHFMGFEPLVCANDGEAVEKAARLVAKYPVELWSGGRLVKRIATAGKPDGATQPLMK